MVRIVLRLSLSGKIVGFLQFLKSQCRGGEKVKKLWFLDCNMGNGGEDLFTLDAEITELQRENARVESQMLRLKTDINAMEAHLRHGDKVGPR